MKSSRFAVVALLLLTCAFTSCKSKRNVLSDPMPTATAYTIPADTVPPTAQDVLQATLDRLKEIHTASYILTKETYVDVNDTAYISVSTYKYDEYENPADTFGNARMIVHSFDLGKFEYAYDGKNNYYGRDNGYEKSRPVTWRTGVTYAMPPFFNRATRLAEYLLTPNPKLGITLSDRNDRWYINAEVNEFNQVVFLGYPIEGLGYMDAKTVFEMEIGKEDLMPTMLSYYYGYPPNKFVERCNDAIVNPFPLESFDVASALPGEVWKAKPSTDRKSYFESLVGTTVPDTKLMDNEGHEFSLRDFAGQPVFLMLTLMNCGPCNLSYPYINKLNEEYASHGVKILAVLIDDNAQPDALRSFKEKKGLNFTVARNNDNLHQHFSCDGISPTFVAIDRNGIVTAIDYGFDGMKPEKTERKLHQMIESSL